MSRFVGIADTFELSDAEAKLPGPPRTTWTPENQNRGPGQIQSCVVCWCPATITSRLGRAAR